MWRSGRGTSPWQRLLAVIRGRAARSTSWAMLGQSTAILASTANFLLLARIVGPEEYGLIAGTWALVLGLAPIAALGSDRLIVRDVTQGRITARAAFGAALLTAATGWVAALALLAAFHFVLLPQTPLLLLLLLAVADLVALGTVTLITSLWFALGNARNGGLAMSVSNLTRLLSVLLFAATGGDDAVEWAVWYASFALLSASLQLMVALRSIGRPSLERYRFRERIREGLPYSSNMAAATVQNDVDKTFLVRFGEAEAAGHYSVAYRLAAIAYLPVLAALQPLFPRFFASGERGGIHATAALGKRVTGPFLLYGVLASVASVVFAPIVPLLVGEAYAESVLLLQLLAPLVLLKTLQSVAGDVLTGAGLQKTRMWCVVVAAVTNVALNLALIPTMGVVGALIATAVAEVLQVALLLGAVKRGLRV